MSHRHIDVRYVANLARLELTADEVATFQPQLEAILGDKIMCDAWRSTDRVDQHIVVTKTDALCRVQGSHQHSELRGAFSAHAADGGHCGDVQRATCAASWRR